MSGWVLPMCVLTVASMAWRPLPERPGVPSALPGRQSILDSSGSGKAKRLGVAE